MCMGGCGGKKASTNKKVSSTRPQFGSPPKSTVRRTNWQTGFGAPKIKFTFGKSR